MKLIPLFMLFFAVNSLAQKLNSKQIVLKEGTNMAIGLSPDGKSIALDLQGTIYKISSSGGNALALTDGMGDDRQPHWTPDGKRVIFQSYRGGTFHIWSVNSEGKDLKQHTTGPFDHREPFASPDGKSILCSSDRNGNYDIWKQNLATGEMTALTTNKDHDYAPAYSPDNKTLAFASTRSEGAGIYLVYENGSEKLLAATGKGIPNAPAWSSDGLWVSYQVANGSQTALMKVEVATGKIVQMSKQGDDVFPFRASWVSNNKIFYTSDGKIKAADTKNEQISEVPFQVKLTVSTPVYQRKTYDFDGINVKNVKGIRCPVVSPDGKQVVFVALGDMWLLTIGNPKPVKLTDDIYYETDPTWSPDGTKILFSADKSGNMDLYTLELSTKNVTQLTKTDEDENQGSWVANRIFETGFTQYSGRWNNAQYHGFENRPCQESA